jgi:hypothetical protein
MRFTILILFIGTILAGYFVFSGLNEINNVAKDNVQSFHEKQDRHAEANELMH